MASVVRRALRGRPARRRGGRPGGDSAAPDALPWAEEPFADSFRVEGPPAAGTDALAEENEPLAYPPTAQGDAPTGADVPPSPDATVDGASHRADQAPSAFHEPIVPAPQEHPYPEDPAYPASAALEPASADEQPSGEPTVSSPAPPPLPPPPAPTANRAPAPERSIRSPVSRRPRSLLARVAAVFALAAVVAALLLLFHSLRSKPAAKVAVPTVVKVVIPEGKTRPQIAQIASAAGLVGSYRAASRRSPLLNPAHYGAPHPTSTLEGFLFPATYDMDKGAPVSRLVQEQLIAFRENFGAQEFARARALHVTPYDLLIVASMVEREAQVPGDRAKIAAVIYNRLREGMPLGIDATIYYAVELAKGIPTYTHELSEAQLHIDSPYNTRLHAGLPPTPISNPGLASIHAAAHPAHVSYLYYVAGADGCGEQVFSNTLAEFEVHSAAYKAAVENNGGHPPACKHTLTGTPSGRRQAKAPRRARLAGRAQPLAGDPQRRARRARDGRLALPAAARPAAAVRRDRPRTRAGGLRGANVTIPHKHAALALADTASHAAREIGAANTLTFSADGAIAAENTDAPGLIAALGQPPGGLRALVLGAGGSARAAVWALHQAGAAEVSIWNRTSERAETLARALGARAVPRPTGADLLINCTSVGLQASDLERSATEDEALNQLGLTFDQVGEYSHVVDLVYRPGSTQLLAAARAHGARTVDGLDVLVAQGALSLELWTGRPAPLEVMRAAARGR